MAAVVIQLVVILIVAGLLVWLINNFLPIDPRFKQLITVVVVVGCVIYIIWALLTAAKFVT